MLLLLNFHKTLMYTMCQKTTNFNDFFIFEILRKFDIGLNILEICSPHLTDVATMLHTSGNQRSHFQQYYSYILVIAYLISEKKQTVTICPPHLKMSPH